MNSRLNDIKEYCSDNICILLIGNKCDLEEKRKVTYKEGADFADKNGIKFLEISPKNDINIKETFETIAEDMIKVKYDIHERAHFDKLMKYTSF